MLDNTVNIIVIFMYIAELLSTCQYLYRTPQYDIAYIYHTEILGTCPTH